ncbi:MAG: hypothetical protein V7647_4165 [Acidobacteriota bacterium]
MNGVMTADVQTAAQAAGAATPARAAWGFPELFVISQTALPALLYLPGTQGFRLPIRFSAFGISLAAFGWWQMQSHDRPPAHRAYPWVAAVMGLLALMLSSPYTSSLIAGIAQMSVYFAVMSPLFWAPVFVRTPEHLARLLGIVLVCSGVNSMVGVLQVYDPARWMPTELSRVVTEGATGLGTATYQGPNGRTIVRPPGLFDTPGAVAGPGMFAALLGVIFGLSPIAAWKRAGSFALAGAGLAAIYLSQVRISLAVTLLMFGIYAGILMFQRRAAKATAFAMLAAAVVVASFIGAITLGGVSVLDRFMTLVNDDPLAVYYRARGVQLNLTFNQLLFDYPLGAGLGRWGMTGAYFGTPGVPGIWAEIQMTGWMIDGGVLMIVLYAGALIATAASQYRLAMQTRYPRVAVCGGVVFAANLGIAVMVFSFTPFVTQIGIQYWFLAGALHGVACHYRLQSL